MNKIYVLRDPDGLPRYVGKTSKNLTCRLNQHIASARAGEKNHKANWIRSLLHRDQRPSIEWLETCGDSWKERETFWIIEGRRLGWKLTNGNDGGKGGESPTLEVREKIAASKRGKKRPAHVGEAVRQSNLRRDLTGQVEAMRLANIASGRWAA